MALKIAAMSKQTPVHTLTCLWGGNESPWSRHKIHIHQAWSGRLNSYQCAFVTCVSLSPQQWGGAATVVELISSTPLAAHNFMLALCSSGTVFVLGMWSGITTPTHGLIPDCTGFSVGGTSYSTTVYQSISVFKSPSLKEHLPSYHLTSIYWLSMGWSGANPSWHRKRPVYTCEDLHSLTLAFASQPAFGLWDAGRTTEEFSEGTGALTFAFLMTRRWLLRLEYEIVPTEYVNYSIITS